MSLFSFGANTSGGGAFGGGGGGGGGGGSFGGFGASSSNSSNALGGPSGSSNTSGSGGSGGGGGGGAATSQAGSNQVIHLSGPPPSREAAQLMCTPAAIATGAKEKSFEEVRMDDYVLFYRNTGRAPPPVPETPTTQPERTAQGLPPLFEPQLIEDSKPAPEELPEWQIFSMVHVGSGTAIPDKMHTITAMPTMSGFSIEELRYYAYLGGRVQPPQDVIVEAQTQQSGFGASPTKSNGIQFGADTHETYLSISTKPEFSMHSFEELRVAYMQAGREMNSNEILGIPAAAAAASGPSSTPLAKAPTLVIPSNSTGFGSASTSGPFSFTPTQQPTSTFKF
ncbi:hypothetical protein K435DRAFT_784764 [Dendrothele bispora CBS 962.96]|uniref:Uncharacterized protein n=1 Tax=Dendrothele bispora (strain CBS 962.96) TaxID=1314807 RepID=A0A4V4HC61_DENBC|nr:hypothetical protein K435DRAFT_784764 [Dendrothele bispora CBS 962.96]